MHDSHLRAMSEAKARIALHGADIGGKVVTLRRFDVLDASEQGK